MSAAPYSLSLRSTIQQLPRVADRTLSVVGLLSSSLTNDEFSTSEYVAFSDELRLPKSTNPSSDLGKLKANGYLVRPTAKTWALSPSGEIRVHQLLPQGTAPASESVDGSMLGGKGRHLVPPLISSGVSQEALRRLVGDGGFDRNVMLITRFPSATDDVVAKLIPLFKQACADHGLELHVASDAQLEDTLWANVVSYMWGCRYAIVVLDAPGAELNSNVLIELGGMLMTGRRCAVLRDKSVPKLPTDLVGHIYKSVDLSDAAGCTVTIHDWLRNDLGLGACIRCGT